MNKKQLDQWPIQDYALDDHILTWVDAFLVDRKAQNMSKGTLYFYQKKLQLFAAFCDSQALTKFSQMTPGFIRDYLLHLESRGHNPGGIHCAFRALRTFLYWWEDETEPEDWRNPIRRVKAPRLPQERQHGHYQSPVSRLYIRNLHRGT